ncbi:MAG: lysine transporter LysE [Candidatus Verstraetearchaeota archaeon]|nr:lysine transporter LysE [Candidatus Verstraetearchaeota archaeon]
MLTAGFILSVIAISASGVMGPGPLTVATIATGVGRSWKAGLLVGAGHLVVELPLVLLIALGVLSFISEGVNRWITLFGGIFMIAFGAATLRGARGAVIEGRGGGRGSGSPLVVGIGLSALNPYFIIWWLTVGTPLIMIAVGAMGLVGVGIMYISHVWMDFAWLSVLAGLGSEGKRLGRLYPYLVGGLGVLIMVFGIQYIIGSLLG